MQKVLYVELIVVCILISLIILCNDMGKDRATIAIKQNLFRMLILSNVLAMFFDGLTYLYDGTTYAATRLILWVGMTLYYVLHSLVGYFYLLYVDFELFEDRDRFFSHLPYYSILSGITILTCLTNVKTGLIFTIDEHNVYQRGPIYMVPMLLSFLYIFHATYICLEWAKQDGLANRRSRSLFKRLILFPLLPCVGGLIQMALPETLAIFVFTSIAILTNYIQEQNSQMVRDHLTGLYNRRQLENYLNNQLKSMKPDKSCFFLIMVDVDDFKNINDTYGHVVGDDALAHTAKILVKSFRKKEDFVARLGGDEFVVIGQVMEKEDVARLAGRLEQITKEFNEKARKPYKLSFSVGCSFAKGDGKDTLDSLINAADQQMYINKRAKKEKRKIEQMEKQGREKSDGQMAEKITMAEKIQINA